jgi:hypothetical protein
LVRLRGAAFFQETLGFGCIVSADVKGNTFSSWCCSQR